MALLTTPATALYAIGGLLASPIVIPALILKNLAVLAIFTPFLLLTLPVAIPIGGIIAAALLALKITKSFIIVFTPLLWPIYYLCAWWGATCMVAQIIVTDTVMPWLVSLRFTLLAAILPKVIMA